MSTPLRSSTIHVIGMPLDHGAGRRGVGMGPSSIRIARLHDEIRRLGYAVEDLGDVAIPAPETAGQERRNAKYLSLITRACTTLAEEVRGVLDKGGFPVVIGGDHSMAIGTISGIASHLHAQDPERGIRKLGIIWFDAHADINTPETSPSGNIHGMPVSCLLNNGPEELTSIGFPGHKATPSKFVQIGIRDIDNNERELLKESGIYSYTMSDIDRDGMVDIVERAIEIATRGTDMLHVSFDIDSLDPSVAPGTGTPSRGGLTYREAHLALEMIAETKRLTSFELAEVNPVLDIRNQTSEVAVGLIASALGRRIL